MIEKIFEHKSSDSELDIALKSRIAEIVGIEPSWDVGYDPDRRIEPMKDVAPLGQGAYDPDKRIEGTVGAQNEFKNKLLHPIDWSSRESVYADNTKEENEIGIKNNPREILCRNRGLENDVHPITGVPFERMVIETPSGEHIEGVFPKFECVFKTTIPKDKYEAGDAAQFKECNAKLLERIEKDPDLKKKFTEEQINQIKDGKEDGSAPDGYVWHHEPQAGVIALVDSDVHAKTGHTGGRVVWGGGSDNR